MGFPRLWKLSYLRPGAFNPADCPPPTRGGQIRVCKRHLQHPAEAWTPPKVAFYGAMILCLPLKEFPGNVSIVFSLLLPPIFSGAENKDVEEKCRPPALGADEGEAPESLGRVLQLLNPA